MRTFILLCIDTSSRVWDKSVGFFCITVCTRFDFPSGDSSVFFLFAQSGKVFENLVRIMKNKKFTAPFHANVQYLHDALQRDDWRNDSVWAMKEMWAWKNLFDDKEGSSFD
jgi:hypothetical protein